MKRNSDRFGQAIVGFFMITLMALLAYFTIVISGVDILMGRHRRSVTVAFAEVGGLKDHDDVVYRGTKVGVVEHVIITPTNLFVEAKIDESVTLRENCRISVCKMSMLGGNYLLLEEGTGREIDPVGRVLTGEKPTDWMREITQIIRNLDEITSGPDLQTLRTNLVAMSTNARAFTERADAIAARLERGEGTIGKMLHDDGGVYDDLKSTLANAKGVSEKLNRAQLIEDLSATVASLRRTAERFEQDRTAEKAGELMDNLNQLAKALGEGKGTLGKLIEDPKLYTEVDLLIRDARQVLDNFRDTTPISAFSALATGAF